MTTINKTNPFILSKKLTSDDLEEEYDHKEFKQWISDLPIGNVNETARALHHELQRHKRLHISPVERFEAIQLMLPALGLVLEKMRAHLATKSIPLSGESKLIAKLHLELLVGIVITYKMVLAQFHDESFTGHLMHKHARAEALRRALFFLGEILLYEYSAYTTSPRFVWQEIHGIYHYAVINELLLKEIDADGIVGDLTVDDIYKRTLLLALADSGGLLRGEIKRISKALTDWLPEVSLVPIGQKVPSSLVFVVDATKDAPPCVVDESGLKNIKIGWVLRVDKLGLILDKKLNAIREKSNSKLRPVDLVPATLYSKLRKRWTPDIVVREKRAEGYGSVSVTCGLESLYWLFGGWKLQHEVDSDSEITTGAGEEAIYDKPILSVEQDEFLINVDAELYASIAAESGHKQEQKEPDPEIEEKKEEEFYSALINDDPEGEACTCVNRSKRGYCLAWSGAGEYKAHVGELVGINSRDGDDFDGSWDLGVIRWMRLQGNDLMGFGVELFEGDIQAIQLDSQHAGDSAVDTILGFLQKINGRIESLITKPFFYGDNNKLLLVSGDGTVPVVPGEIIECTDAFMRFRVRFDSSVVKAKKDSPKRQSESEDIFSNIWEDL